MQILRQIRSIVQGILNHGLSSEQGWWGAVWEEDVFDVPFSFGRMLFARAARNEKVSKL